MVCFNIYLFREFPTNQNNLKLLFSRRGEARELQVSIFSNKTASTPSLVISTLNLNLEFVTHSAVFERPRKPKHESLSLREKIDSDTFLEPVPLLLLNFHKVSTHLRWKDCYENKKGRVGNIFR